MKNLTKLNSDQLQHFQPNMQDNSKHANVQDVSFRRKLYGKLLKAWKVLETINNHLIY